MTDAPGPATPTRRLDRLLAFSDGVFAIALTLLALELKAPVVDRAHVDALLPHELLRSLPAYLGFLISFVVVALYWRAHHRMFDGVVDCDRRVVVLDFLVLFGVVVLPFPTSLVGLYGANGRVPAVTYASTVAFVALASFLLSLAVERPGLLGPGRRPLPLSARLEEATVPAVFLASIAVAARRPRWAILLWCAVPVFQALVVRGLGPLVHRARRT